ncbi:MAG: class I SAM-dependent methyltransferase [Nitrososphaerales archaeon]|jgi:ubiquinone/menaquinone biosynthesis C-methylase UbiE
MASNEADVKEFVRKFQGRADIYAKYRPSYPIGVLLTLRREIGFDQERVVADIGSGTGILSELFLENGNRVYCVEPNEDMRRVAEERLRRYAPRYISVNGTAEATNLKSDSIDLVAVGQALHWFDVEKTRAEFARILRRGGYVSIVYNHRKREGGVEEAYGRVIDRFAKNRAAVPEVDDAYVARFLKNREFKKSGMPNSQSLDFKGMLGRLASASYMPPPDNREWIEVEKEVRGIFDEHGSSGFVMLHYDTILYLGRITPS